MKEEDSTENTFENDTWLNKSTLEKQCVVLSNTMCGACSGQQV